MRGSQRPPIGVPAAGLDGGGGMLSVIMAPSGNGE
jgi:hypothetical protein